MSNLAQRLLVAVIGIPIVIFIVLVKPLALLGLVVLLAVLTVHEYYGLAQAKGIRPLIIIGCSATALLSLSFGSFRLATLLHLNFDRLTSLQPVTAVLILLFVIVMLAELQRALPNPIMNMATTVFGVVYVGLGLGAFYGIHEHFYVVAASALASGNPSSYHIDSGMFCVVVLASIWICDSGAYFGGRAFGKHKLFERVSPKKTWEGAISGGLMAIATWFAARAFLPGIAAISVVDALVFGLIVAIFGQTGDLAKSILKRDAGVKDSSNLIPGHGGVLDRLDSLLFVSPLIFLYLQFTGH